MTLAQATDGSVSIVVPIPASGIEAAVFRPGEGGVLYTYLGTVFAWVAGIAGALLLVAVIYYGFLLMFSGIHDATAEAKKGLAASVGGIVLLMCSGLLLYTLNPNFFGGFGTDPTGTVLGAGGEALPPGGTPPPGQPPVPPPTQGSTASVAEACEPVGLRTRGDASEPVGQRPDVNPQNIAAKKQKFAKELAAAVAQPGIAPVITVDFLAAIMQQENSGADARLRSSVGALGIMQVLPAAAADYCSIPEGSAERLFDVQTNINCSAKMLSAFHRAAVGRYGRTDALRSTIAAYNGGPGRLVGSSSCAGQGACGQTATQWECLWDDTAHTLPNYKRAGGSLVETRNYVGSVLRGMGACPDVAQACG